MAKLTMLHARSAIALTEVSRENTTATLRRRGLSRGRAGRLTGAREQTRRGCGRRPRSSGGDAIDGEPGQLRRQPKPIRANRPDADAEGGPEARAAMPSTVSPDNS